MIKKKRLHGDLIRRGLSDQSEEAGTPHHSDQLYSRTQGVFNQGNSWLSNHMMVANYGVAKSPYMLKLQENNAKAG